MVKTDIFLSHNWGDDKHGRNNHERVAIINKKLNELGYKTWLDEKQMYGNIQKRMAEGIENTQGVLVFVTKKYQEKVNQTDNPNDNCLLEFNHATDKVTTSKMIAIVMEKDTTEWTGVFSMHLKQKMYVDFTGDLNDCKYLNKQMEMLNNELRKLGIQPTGNIISVEGKIKMEISKHHYKNSIMSFLKS